MSTTTDASRPPDKTAARAPDLLFWVAAAVLLFLDLGARSLWTAEERWAEITREMFLTGRFFHPTLNDLPYFDKPLLGYWLIALVKVLAGRLDEWAVRLPSAVAGLVALGALRNLGTRLWSPAVGRLAGWILLGTYGFLFWARTGQADMENLAAILLALAWYWARRDRPTFGAFLVFYLILALGAQCKGLGAIVVPLVALAPDMLRQRRWRLLFSIRHIAAALLGAAVYMAPFLYSAVTSANYQSSGLYLVFRENILRYVEPFDHVEPFYAYVYHLPVLFLPWAPILLAGLAAVLANARTAWPRNPSTRWLAAAAILVFLFFSASGSRRSYYILPMLPFCALFCAIFLESPRFPGWRAAALRIQFCLALVVALVLIVAGPLMPAWAPFPPDIVVIPWSLAIPPVLALAVALAAWRRPAWLAPLIGLRPAPAALAVMTALLLGVYFCAWQGRLERVRTTRQFSMELAGLQRAAPELAFYEFSYPVVIFYMNSTPPHPVLVAPDAIAAFLRAAPGQNLLVLREREVAALQPRMPAGFQFRPVLRERVYEFDRHKDKKLLAVSAAD